MNAVTHVFLRFRLVALVLALLLSLSGCAGLAGMGVDGKVTETTALLPDPQIPPTTHPGETTIRWRDKQGNLHSKRVKTQIVDSPPPRDMSPGVPSRDAWVIVMWRYSGSYSDGCVHGVVVRTDARGEFHAHSWFDPLNFGPEFFPWRRYQRLDQAPFIVLHPFTGGLKKRLQEVFFLSDQLNCSSSSLIAPPSPQMAPFLLAMLDEADALARTKQEHDQVEQRRNQVRSDTGLIKSLSE